MKILTTDTLPENFKLIEVIDTVMATGSIPLTEKNHEGLLSLITMTKEQDPTLSTLFGQLQDVAKELGGNIIFGLRVTCVPYTADKRQHALYTLCGTVAKCDISEEEVQPD